MNNQPILIPARTDVSAWKTILSKCPKWILSMQFSKAVSKATNNRNGLNVFTHPTCLKACKTVVEYNKIHPHETKPNV